MNGTMSSLGQGNSVPAEAWESTMVEALSLVHKQSLRMRMEFWIEALLNDQSREMALYVLAEVYKCFPLREFYLDIASAIMTLFHEITFYYARVKCQS